MKEIIKKTLKGEFFDNLFSFPKTDKKFLDMFNQNANEIIIEEEKNKIKRVENSTEQFKIKEKKIQEQSKAVETKIIISDLNVDGIKQIEEKKQNDNTEADVSWEKYKKRKLQDALGSTENEVNSKDEKDVFFNGLFGKKDTPQKKRKIPTNVTKALEDKDIPLPILQKEKQMLEELQRGDSRIML